MLEMDCCCCEIPPTLSSSIFTKRENILFNNNNNNDNGRKLLLNRQENLSKNILRTTRKEREKKLLLSKLFSYNPIMINKTNSKFTNLLILIIIIIVSYLTILSNHLALVNCIQNESETTLINNIPLNTNNSTLSPVSPSTESSGNNNNNEISNGNGEGGLVFSIPSSIKPNDDPKDRLEIIQKARNNEISADIKTNKTRSMVSCETGEILVKINFTEPFRGVGYANYDRSSPCKFFGEGGDKYEMRLPLKGCGTRQEAPRLFVNNIILRFHRSLELEEDEEITIVCRYPPPLAPEPPPRPPGLPAEKLIQLEPAKLTQYEPFVLIAGLLFFTLLFAGIGTTSYLTKKEILKPINTPLPITSIKEFDTYVDNQSIITTQDLLTNQTIIPFPKITTHTVDDVFITNLHEIETEENLIHHKHIIPKSHLSHQKFEDTYITNEEEIITEDILRKQKLAEKRKNLNRLNYDDTYVTNQDENTDEENLTNYKLRSSPSKIELRTIEDTFITKVDEVVENVNTTYLKDHKNRQFEEQQLHQEHEELEFHEDYYRNC